MKNSMVEMRKFGRKDVELKSVKPLFEGFFSVNEYQLTHKLFKGGESDTITREIFERGDAVVMLPYDAIRDTLVLQTQFRPGAIRDNESPWLIECVAGMFGEQESPVDVAIREAEEEAGLAVSASDVIPIMQYFSSPGGTTEKIHLYLGIVDSTNVGGVFGLDNEQEDILVTTHTREEAMKMLSEGKIVNAATIIGLQWLQLNYRSIRAKYEATGV